MSGGNDDAKRIATQQQLGDASGTARNKKADQAPTWHDALRVIQTVCFPG